MPPARAATQFLRQQDFICAVAYLCVTNVQIHAHTNSGQLHEKIPFL